jgi:probable F420-dependent oxidoreductase
VRVYAGMDPRLPLRHVAAYARRVEAMGYDGLHVPETIHDGMAVALLAVEHTERIVVRTSVVLAFVRSPTLTAYAAWDLAQLSGGRFQLGLGTQIRQNIEHRHGMPWSEPVGRLRDFVESLQALYRSFRTGEPLQHEGPFFRLTRMQPFFNPGPDAGTVPPPTWLGGVNAGVCRLAGELADGFVTHPTNSDPRYLAEVCLPALAEGAARSGRSTDDLELVVGTPMITGPDEGAVEQERERQRRMMAFLWSTPAYARTLELYGWGHLTDEVRSLIHADRWDDLGHVVPDEVLETLVPTAGYDDLAGVLLERFGGLADGLVVPPPADRAHDPIVTRVIEAIRAGDSTSRGGRGQDAAP